MSPHYPTVTPNKIRAVLKRCGFEERRQSGSHLTLRHPESGRIATVPMHRGDLKLKTLISILKQAGLTVDELGEML